MGEECDFLTEARLFYTVDGETHELNIEPVQILKSQLDARNDSSETFVNFKRTKEMRFTCSASISKRLYFVLMLGPNKRMIRRAFRWYEKYRRKGISKECLAPFACSAVMTESNNKKRRKKHESV